MSNCNQRNQADQIPQGLPFAFCLDANMGFQFCDLDLQKYGGHMSFQEIASLDEFQYQTEQWLQKRGFIALKDVHDQDKRGQVIKLVEDLGELCDKEVRGRRKDVKEDVGDMLLVLVGLAVLHGFTLLECAEHAYNEIKDRKGRIVNGVFVKEPNLVGNEA